MAIAVEIVSTWFPLPATVCMTPPLLSRRLPLLRVYLKADVLEKVIPPMLRLLSTVTMRSAPRVKSNAAISGLSVREVEPGVLLSNQLPAVAQLPLASTFQLEEAANEDGVIARFAKAMKADAVIAQRALRTQARSREREVMGKQCDRFRAEEGMGGKRGRGRAGAQRGESAYLIYNVWG